jgi:hypothetical protein
METIKLEIGGSDIMTFGKINLFIATMCLIACLLGGGCLVMKPLSYTVAIINDGRDAIMVEPFELANTQDATVEVGEVVPKGRKSLSPFYNKPLHKVTISWRVIKTGKKGEAQVQPELPSEFTKDAGSAIVFHIKPEEGIVDVTYEILDLRTGQINSIREGEGSP